MLASHTFQSCPRTFRIISKLQGSYFCVGNLAVKGPIWLGPVLRASHTQTHLIFTKIWGGFLHSITERTEAEVVRTQDDQMAGLGFRAVAAGWPPDSGCRLAPRQRLALPHLTWFLSSKAAGPCASKRFQSHAILPCELIGRSSNKDFED